jgi:hypothetical protein
MDTKKLDYSILLSLLENYNWKKNPIKTRPTGYKGGRIREDQYSVNVGYVRRIFVKGLPIMKGQFMKKNNDEIYNECKRLFPDFIFDGVMINKNFKCPPHKDKNNNGDSMIIGLGNYENGELVVENEPIDIKYEPYIFNGSKKEHYVNDWINGDRYSVVLFKL